jgi:hypothetical protein
MLFDTPIYLLFLALVVAVYWRLNLRRQNIFLLLASYFFYGSGQAQDPADHVSCS